MDTSINRIISKRIRAAREKAGFSQTKLADCVDVSYQQIQKYEKGTSKLSSEMLWRISRVFDCHISYFFGYEPVAVKNDGEQPGKVKTGKLQDRQMQYAEEVITIKEEKLSVDEKIVLKGYRAMRNNDAKRGILLVLKGFIKLKQTT